MHHVSRQTIENRLHQRSLCAGWPARVSKPLPHTPHHQAQESSRTGQEAVMLGRGGQCCFDETEITTLEISSSVMHQPALSPGPIPVFFISIKKRKERPLGHVEWDDMPQQTRRPLANSRSWNWCSRSRDKLRHCGKRTTAGFCFHKLKWGNYLTFLLKYPSFMTYHCSFDF